ncbi:hypothetical protein [Novosphingobium sp. M1R2S20]|uniref:Uncharacterized protein n=1 Tax=Novosphingobium rhizovicinum TaxID=3228928 RepID=A0ABV3RAN2_9SPHN
MVDHRPDGGRSKRGILIAVLVVVLLLIIAWMAGLFDVDTQGELAAPEVDMSVQGGALPEVDADVADINVGTETQTVEVPTVDVNAAEADEE